MFPCLHDDFGIRSMDAAGLFWVHPALHVEPDRMESPGTWCGPSVPMTLTDLTRSVFLQVALQASASRSQAGKVW